MTTDQRVAALIAKVEEKRMGLNTYIVNGSHTSRELLSLKTQEAGFTYMINELNKVLSNS